MNRCIPATPSFFTTRPPRIPTLFPYTTLFRSIRLAARRPAQHQRQLAVGSRLLGEVVVNAQRRLFLLVHEVLGHGTAGVRDRKSTRLNSSHQISSYAVFCLKKKKKP